MSLSPESVDPDPIAQFQRWFDEARAAGVRQPEAMTLATAAPDGAVTARTVLMRGLDARGFAFYTNRESAKAGELAANPRAALVFHWREQERQVRVTGPVVPLAAAEAAQYWATRPRGHRIGAWASPQSRVVDLTELDARVAEVEDRFAGSDPPLPPFWGGYLVGVDELELWQGRPDRLHDRVRYARAQRRLAPGTACTVNTATAVAFAVAAVFAAGDWIASARKQRVLEYVCKPATLAALIVAACVMDPAAGADGRRAWFVVALGFCLAGDVLLMLPQDLFVAGLAAFLVGHLAYVAGFWTDPPALGALAVSALVVLVVIGVVARRILRALRSEPEMRVPVTAYIAVISVMLATALATGNPWAAGGAALFAASDSMIAWDRFVKPFPAAAVVIMVTYHLGQAGLVASLLR